MISPIRKIWLCPDFTFTGARNIEILILGPTEEIAGFVARVKGVLEDWRGFENVEPIVMGIQQVGFRATSSKWANHMDPVAEAILMLEHFSIAWRDNGGNVGAVGSW